MSNNFLVGRAVLVLLVLLLAGFSALAYTDDALQDGYHDPAHIDNVHSASGSNIVFHHRPVFSLWPQSAGFYFDNPSHSGSRWTLYQHPSSGNILLDRVGGGSFQIGRSTALVDVGVNVASPQERLHVLGNVRADGFCIGGDCITSWPSGNGVPGNGGSNWVLSGGNVYRSSGNVGIGTSSPSRQLSLTDSGVGLERVASNALGFFTGNSERMRIDNLGRVGIGANSPQERLHVLGNVRADGFCIGGDCITSWPSGNGDGSLWTQSGNVIYYNQGWVGIGTSSPQQRLDVQGSFRANRICIGDDCRTDWPSESGSMEIQRVQNVCGSPSGPCDISCPFSDQVIIGGGCLSDETRTSISKNYPIDSTTWRCDFYRGDGAIVSGAIAYAMCARGSVEWIN